MALILVAAALAGCGDEGDEGRDLSTTFDLTMPDLPVGLPDLSGCVPPVFGGFSGASDVERRLDCTACGCTVDPLVAPSGLWVQTLVAATMSGGPDGLEISADGASGSAYGALASINPTGPFYLDGDFDLRVDYELLQAVPGGKVNLRVDVGPGVFWEVARARTLAGEDVFSSLLGGTPPTSVAAMGTSGTLRLTRAGFTITAYANGVEIAKNLSGSAARATIYVAAGVNDCSAPDGGGGGCTLRARVRDLRLGAGVLVDRR